MGNHVNISLSIDTKLLQTVKRMQDGYRGNRSSIINFVLAQGFIHLHEPIGNERGGVPAETLADFEEQKPKKKAVYKQLKDY